MISSMVLPISLAMESLFPFIGVLLPPIIIGGIFIMSGGDEYAVTRPGVSVALASEVELHGLRARQREIVARDPEATPFRPRVGRYHDEEVYGRLEQAPHLARRILPQSPFCMAEIVHAIEGEMARSLEDIFRRRIPLTLVARLSRVSLKDACRLAADRLQWSQARLNTELNALVHARKQRTFTQ